MDLLLDILRRLSWLEVTLFFAVTNLAIFALSVASCWWLGQRFRGRRLFDRWEPFSWLEGLAAVGAVVLNTVISVIGWWLWVGGWIELQAKPWPLVLLDVLVMTLALDLGMYVLHRMAHIPLLYRLLHAFHHRHEVTNPISLFVLHPFEVAGFGGLMVSFLLVYSMDPWALVGYLTLNVLFGTLGHSGVEPFPAGFVRVPLLKWMGTSTFHAEHHEHPKHNFGFYTLIWDQLFGTLDPQYWQRYRDAVAGRSHH